MTLYIDIENKKLVQSLTSDRSVPIPTFMQGDNEPLELHLLEKGEENLYKEKALVVGTDFIRVAIARFKGYPKSLTYASGYTLNANGGAEIVLPLNTTAIEQAVQDNEYITAFLEVEYSNTEGKIVTILQTSCRLKNDLVDNAPSIELQDQFYDKVYIDEIFSKKSANLSDLSDKSESRSNLDVYAKSETYNKPEIDLQEALNLKKSNNLEDLENKPIARTNLNVYSKYETYSKNEIDAKDSTNLKVENNLSDVSNTEKVRLNLDVPRNQILAKFGMSGIFSISSLSPIGYHDAALADDLISKDNSTFLTTYLGNGEDYFLCTPYYGDYGIFSPQIQNNGSELNLGYVDYYDEETGDYISQEFRHKLSSPIEFGDKIALILKGSDFYLYKNIELVASGEIPSQLYIYNPTYVLCWGGLKKDLIYSNSIALPITKADANTLGFPYSVEDFINEKYPPSELLKSRFSDIQTEFTSDYSNELSYLKIVGGNSIGGKTQALKLSIIPTSYTRERIFKLSSRYWDICGVEYTVSFNIYLPTDNPNISKAQVRIGNVDLSSSGTIISKTNNIDNIGFILPKDEWQKVQFTINTNNQKGYPSLYLYKGASPNMQINTETSDTVYIRDIKVSCSQAIECFYYGATRGGVWKNLGASNCDLISYAEYSHPCEVSDEYVFRQNVSNFSYGISIPFENHPKNLELLKIILKFNSEIPDTSDETLPEVDRNIFNVSLDYNSEYMISEHLPAIPSYRSYIIYPKISNKGDFGNITIAPMNNINSGGTVEFVFRKAK